MIAALTLMLTLREEFVDSLGGAAAPAGTTGLTVGQLADRLEAALGELTSPGYRVYDPAGNQRRFWERLLGRR